MIAFVEGEIVELYEDRVVVENQCIGYEIFVPGSLIARLPQVGQRVRIYTYLYVREDAMQLYGFMSRDDLTIFKLLLGVSGIGPKGALGILSAITPDELRMAILAGDSKTISKAPGIGNKTAQKLIIELKDKVDITDVTPSGNDSGMTGTMDNQAAGDAVEALTALGYPAGQALKAVNMIEQKEDMDVEQILSLALKNIAREG